MVPTGSDPQTVDQYYHYLFEKAVGSVEVLRTGIDWTGPMLRIYVWGFILGGFFYLFSTRLWWQHRRSGELYAPVSFGGSILERVGKVSTFTFWVWAAVTAWGISYIVRQIILGWVY